MTCGNSQLSYGLRVRTDVSPGNFHLYRLLANDILARCYGYNSPTANDISADLIYVDRAIK